ncbi:hypothetical protein ES288_A09G076700v1 [Gossypium darwinii]|uniref:Uncharacterized protein n=2 Tax=Gossypium darwinii TaxID=34276 RepID=A0A5D2F6I9_GOSDA|nr:hypothetical protein ES288_A09G076700v1 [Gossypium darwinii]
MKSRSQKILPVSSLFHECFAHMSYAWTSSPPASKDHIHRFRPPNQQLFVRFQSPEHFLPNYSLLLVYADSHPWSDHTVNTRSRKPECH